MRKIKMKKNDFINIYKNNGEWKSIKRITNITENKIYIYDSYCTTKFDKETLTYRMFERCSYYYYLVEINPLIQELLQDYLEFKQLYKELKILENKYDIKFKIKLFDKDIFIYYNKEENNEELTKEIIEIEKSNKINGFIYYINYCEEEYKTGVEL
jgi:hypothetical protein